MFGNYNYTAENTYGVAPQVPTAGLAAPTQHMGTSDMRGGLRGLVDPNNPVFWVGALAVVGLGLAGFAGSVRVGKTRASVNVGDG